MEMKSTLNIHMDIGIKREYDSNGNEIYYENSNG
jgi:hypothetical protein